MNSEACCGVQYELKGKQEMKSRLNALFLMMALVVILFSGCVVSKKDEQFTGIEKSELKQIECGKTTRIELIDSFGEPTEQSMAGDGAEILKYKCTKKKDNSFVMFPPPIVIKDDKVVEHIVAFEIRDDIVQRHWKEQ
jgi:hypothetical protein